MPKLCLFTKKQLAPTKSGASFPFVYKPFKYYIDTTEYSSNFTLGEYSAITDIYDNNIKKFGIRSMSIPALAGTYSIEIPIPDPTSSFVIDLWFYQPSAGGKRPLLEIYDSATTYGFTLWTEFNGGYSPQSWTAGLYSRNSTGSNNNGTCNMEYYGNGNPAVANAWNHFLFVRNNLSTMFCINGYQYNDGSFPGPWLGNAKWHTSYDRIRIGRLQGSNSPGWSGLDVNLDSIHVTSGNERYGKTFQSTGVGSYSLGFTPPTTKPTPQSNTIFLTNFD